MWLGSGSTRQRTTDIQTSDRSGRHCLESTQFQRRSTAVRPVLLALLDELAVLITAGDEVATRLAGEDVLRVGEGRTVDIGVKLVGPLPEGPAVVGRPVALILLDVDEFVAQRRFPGVPVEGRKRVPGQRDRTRKRTAVAPVDAVPVVPLADGGVGQFWSRDRGGAALSAVGHRPLDEVEPDRDAPLAADTPTVLP